MKDYLLFRKMITPVIIQIIFWVGTIITVIYGLCIIILEKEEIFGLMVIVLGPVLWRIYCELMIVIFQINNNLAAIRKNKYTQESSLSLGKEE